MLLWWFVYLFFWLTVSVIVRAMRRVAFSPMISRVLGEGTGAVELPHGVPRGRFDFGGVRQRRFCLGERSRRLVYVVFADGHAL